MIFQSYSGNYQKSKTEMLKNGCLQGVNLQPFNILSMYYFDKINIHPQVNLKQQ